MAESIRDAQLATDKPLIESNTFTAKFKAFCSLVSNHQLYPAELLVYGVLISGAALPPLQPLHFWDIWNNNKEEHVQNGNHLGFKGFVA